MFMKYSSLEYSNFIPAFQLHFGIYEAESERFQWEKENTIWTSGFQGKWTSYILVILLMFDFWSQYLRKS